MSTSSRQTTDFGDWLRAGLRGRFYRAGLAVVVIALLAEIVTSTGPFDGARAVSDYLTRALALAGPLLFIIVLPVADQRLTGDAGQCANAFAHTWRVVLGLWITMSVLFFGEHLAMRMGWSHSAGVLVIGVHTCRNAIAMFVLRAHSELAMKSVEQERGRVGARPDYALILAVVLLMFVLDVYLRFDDIAAVFNVDPGAARKLYDGVFERDAARLRFDVGCWTLYGAVFLVFAARFQSRLIDVEASLLLPIYAFCVLQPIAALRENIAAVDGVSQFAYVASAGASILLMALVHWFIKNRTVYYFTSMRELNYRLRLARTEFGQVRPPEGVDSGVYMALAIAPSSGSPHQNRIKKIAAKIRDRITTATRMAVFCPVVHDHFPDDAIARRENFYRIRQCRVFVLIYDAPGASGALLELGAALSHYRPTIICHSGELPALARPSPTPTPLIEYIPLAGATETCKRLIPAIQQMCQIADSVANSMVTSELALPPPPPVPGPIPAPAPVVVGAPRASTARVDILFVMACNPRKRTALDLEAEARDVGGEIKAVKHRDRMAVRHALAARWDDLVQRIRLDRPSVLHFADHGEQEGIVFRGEGNREQVIPGAILCRFLVDRGVRLVVLNACYSRNHAKELVGVIDVVVGTSTEVDDVAAKSFSVAFYRSIGNGLKVKDAFRDGVDAAAGHGVIDVYYLEGNGDLVLVERMRTRPPDTTEIDESLLTTTDVGFPPPPGYEEAESKPSGPSSLPPSPP